MLFLPTQKFSDVSLPGIRGSHDRPQSSAQPVRNQIRNYLGQACSKRCATTCNPRRLCAKRPNNRASGHCRNGAGCHRVQEPIAHDFSFGIVYCGVQL
jgi:hypothetical protein